MNFASHLILHLIGLDNVSGTVKPGQFLSIIGASGAGKTTLLNYLSNRGKSCIYAKFTCIVRSPNLKKTGDVLINGKNRNEIKSNSYMAYVQQDDKLFQTLTVKEWLEFAASLKLPPDQDHEEIVNELLVSLRLEKAADTKIGGPLVKGVSGGERKRTSIGVELITNPSLIFLDEPTTGLDSFTAEIVVEILKNLADSGRTIISTIHQPNTETFEHFDQLMLMSKGHIIYMNDASKAVDYFKTIGYECPPQTNPADFFMSMMSIEAMDVQDGDDDQVQRSKTMIEEQYDQKVSHNLITYV